MKIIGSVRELRTLNRDLTMFIFETCPWMRDGWDPTEIGYLFILDENDINEQITIDTVPHEDDQEYIDSMMIDLKTFDLWEHPSIQDEKTGYWNVVAIIAGEYGCGVFLSPEYVQSIPDLQQRLMSIKKPVVHKEERPNVEYSNC
jgi:hypothetical protein